MNKNNQFTKEKESELIDILKEPYIYYTDYRDKLETPFLKKLLKDIKENENIKPIELFKELIDECYEDAEFPDPDGYAQDIGLNYYNLSEEDKDKFDETFMEHVYCEPDYDHFLNQDVCIDIIIDSGDYNFDLGCNQIYPHYNGSYEELEINGVPKESCIYWLTTKQGYTEEELKKALLDGIYNKSKFLKTIRNELLNCTSHMNNLVFTKKMTIEEWLKSLDMKEIIISKETGCGLVDYWNGAGGLLNIQLEKDIKIPKENIIDIIPDECIPYNGKCYSIHSIYGCTDHLWN